MNYRHAFHAGNFADVLKHSVLTRVLLHLCSKDAAFRVIDTHAGIGRYDLSGNEANRTLEWKDGIGRLMKKPTAGEAGELLAPYLSLVRNLNGEGELKHYPGSPTIIQSLCREQDRMIFCELHPDDYATLRKTIGRNLRAKTAEIDGWTALKAFLPPKERRGLVLIDPAFEQPDEFDRLTDSFAEGYQRFATGTFLLWYPIKDRTAVNAFERRMAALRIQKIMIAEISVGLRDKPDALHACGLMLVNPPWTLENELKILLPALATALSPEGGEYRLDFLMR